MSRDIDGDVLDRSERPVIGADVLEPDDGRKGRGRSVGRPRDIEVDRRSLFGLDEIWRGRGGHLLSEGCWIRVGGFWPLIRHHRRSYRLRRMIAKAFAITVTRSSTTIAADVSARNSSCGLRAQSKTMTGSAVYDPRNRSSMERPWENEPRTAPTRMRGAVSPS